VGGGAAAGTAADCSLPTDATAGAFSAGSDDGAAVTCGAASSSVVLHSAPCCPSRAVLVLAAATAAGALDGALSAERALVGPFGLARTGFMWNRNDILD
jgi:hypothetical protein